MRRTIRSAVVTVTVTAGCALALAAGTAIAGEDPWPRGSGIAPAEAVPGPQSSRAVAAWPDFEAGTLGLVVLGDEYWPRGTG
ncbi:hypothetical protein [Streptomyces sp. NPDC087300]|uniref:hypothetical protein n=1 Tax=Streptomyces sp. NPDC087300 TaxID=3365780 RepID=UPI00382EFA93